MTLILLIILLVTTPKEEKPEKLEIDFHIYPTGYWDERAEDMINNFPKPK